MSPNVFAFFFVLLNICSSQINPAPKCSLLDTCGACIRELGCAWCITRDPPHQQEFRPCLSEDQIDDHEDDCIAIINPQITLEILQSDSISAGKEISPQKVRLQLRKGQEYKLDFRYAQAGDSVHIFDNSDNNVEVKYFSKCADGILKERNQCDNLLDGEQVNFTAAIKIAKCPRNGQNTKTIFIRPTGLTEALEVQIKFTCGCECEKPGNQYFKRNAPECSNQGDLKCGICNCFPSRLGASCECDRNEGNTNEGLDNCRSDGEAEICSGFGICQCNKCSCQVRSNPEEVIYGKYCECNNFSCRRHQGKLCSGISRGRCDCGLCSCLEGYTGPACECPIATSSCISPGSLDICSGRGECQCGECLCNEEHFGQYCEESYSSMGSRCAELKDCVECVMYGTGLHSKEDCSKNCTKYNVESTSVVDEKHLEPKEKFCTFYDSTECIFKFKYLSSKNGSAKIYAQKDRIC